MAALSIAVMTVWLVALVALTARASCPECPHRRRWCLAVCREVARGMEDDVPASRVVVLGLVRSVNDALVYIEATQGMHVEPLHYRCVVTPAGVEMVEIYKMVAEKLHAGGR